MDLVSCSSCSYKTNTYMPYFVKPIILLTCLICISNIYWYCVHCRPCNQLCLFLTIQTKLPHRHRIRNSNHSCRMIKIIAFHLILSLFYIDFQITINFPPAPLPEDLCFTRFIFLAPAVTEGATEGAMEMASGLLRLLPAITFEENNIG